MAGERSGADDARRWRLALGLVVLAAGLLRVSSLGESLWADEAISLSQARLDLVGMLRATAADNYPPLHNLLLFPLVHVVGEHEVVVRLPSLLLGLGTILVAAALARDLYGRRAGLVAAIFVALSPLQIYYAQEARMYTLLAFTAALATWTLVRWVTSPTAARAAWHIAATVLLCYSHVYAVFIVMAHALWFLWLWARRPRAERPSMRAWLLQQAIALALFAPWLVRLVDRAVEIEARGFWITRPDLWTLVEVAGVYGSVAAPLLFVFMIAALVRRPAPPADDGATTRSPSLTLGGGERGMLLLACVVCTVLVPFFASLVVQPFLHLRYTIAASTAVYVLAAGGLVALARSRRALRVTTAVTVLLFVPLVVLGQLRTRHSDMRTMGALLSTHVAPDDVIAVWPSYDRAALKHYLRAPARVREIPKDHAKAIRAGFAKAIDTPGPVWLVTTWDQPAMLAHFFGRLASDRTPEPPLSAHGVRAQRFGPRHNTPPHPEPPSGER